MRSMFTTCRKARVALLSTAACGSFGGWSPAMYSKTQHRDLAWSLVEIIQRRQNMLELDDYGRLVPPVPAYSSAPNYVASAKVPFQEEFAKLLHQEQSMLANQELGVCGFALAQATETLVLTQEMRIATASKTIKLYVAEQLGDDRIVSLN